jgi:hypothetical protein
MSPDVRSSIYLWLGAVAMGGVLWIGYRSDLFDGMTKTWIGGLVGLLRVVNLGRFAHGLWQRRASNPNNPNGN